MPANLTPEALRRQIEAYAFELPHYKTYANALRRVLEKACAAAVPEAIVQARAKSVSSFAEKCVRKFEKYPDPVNQLTDLCGGRVIVQTLEQVAAVCGFVEQHFQVLERDDKTTALKADQFGYRDMHFIIQVPAECALDFTPEERRAIGNRHAELQVRTWVQHAWADTLHDRMYKTPLRHSAEIKRRGNLLAAVMEEGDRGFSRLAAELDGMIANYAANAGKDDVENEIGVQRLLLESADAGSRPGIALRLARLIAIQGKWPEIVLLLEPHAAASGLLGLELCSELGLALCRANRSTPSSAEYRRGQKFLKDVITESERTETSAVPNLRRARSVHARALARLGWSYEPIEAEAYEARRCWARAVELEPDNPYYLAEMLGFELHFARESGLLASFRATIRAALHACEEHEAAGTELPGAHLIAGRLQLLLEEPLLALNAYARGLRYCVTDHEPGPCDALANEIAWLHRINPGRPLPEAHQWTRDLLALGAGIADCSAASAPAAAPADVLQCPALIVAGGAASLPEAELPRIRDLLMDALADFPGTVLSGGTTSGVPGCLGAVAKALRKTDRKRFHLRGYIPMSLPRDAEEDKRYDQIVVSGSECFSPAQILQSWRDILAAGLPPAKVLLLGWGGGPIAAFEYRLALALGATVGIVSGSGGAADSLLHDPLWTTLPNLFPLPADAKTLRAFVLPDGGQHDPAVLDTMAREFHARYRAGNLRKIKPDTLKLWEDLPQTYQMANREQAAYAIRILVAAGFGWRKVQDKPVVFTGFTPEEVELMAELEHGRWNIERLRNGWRPGVRDDVKKNHDCLVPWRDLSDGPNGVKRFDRDSVRAFPEILALAGLEVYRPGRPRTPRRPSSKKT